MSGLALLPCAPAWAADAGSDCISGKVFLDVNGNGKPDPGEKGIAEVRVTDGISFATTDADGAYSIKIAEDYMIPCRPARTVSVCWPTGKWPTGRWWYRLSEIADAKAVSFGLRNDEQKLPFVFLHTSDDHGAGQMYSEHYAHDARLMKPAAKFIFNTGDMGYATPEGGDHVSLDCRPRRRLPAAHVCYARQPRLCRRGRQNADEPSLGRLGLPDPIPRPGPLVVRLRRSPFHRP
jgi:hypothetical protein